MDRTKIKITSTETYRTITAQPAEVRRLIENAQAWELAERASRILAAASKIFLVGTGTSFHAASMGQYILRKLGLEAWAVSAYEFAHYPQPVGKNDVLVIFSHRGTKLFTGQSLEKGLRHGMKVVVITGQGSPLLEASGVLSLPTTSQEVSSTHTASYITALTVLFQIASFVAEKRDQQQGAVQIRSGLKILPMVLTAGLESLDQIFQLTSMLTQNSRLIISGPGPEGITAQEGALKCKEAAYVTVEGSPLETFLHGPIVGVGSGDHLILVNSFCDGPGAERTAEVDAAAEEIGLKVWILGQKPTGSKTNIWFEIPAPENDEVLSNLVLTVPLQLLACGLAASHGTNPDNFHYDVPVYKSALSKIKL